MSPCFLCHNEVSKGGQSQIQIYIHFAFFVFNPYSPQSSKKKFKIKINLNITFPATLWYLKKFTAFTTFIKPLRYHKKLWKQKFKLIFYFKSGIEMGRVKLLLIHQR